MNYRRRRRFTSDSPDCLSRRPAQVAALLIAVHIGPFASAAPPCTYEVETITGPFCGFPLNEYTPTIPTDIADDGTIVGYSWQCADPNLYRGFVISPEGVFQSLPLPAGVTSVQCTGVNSSGMIVGKMSYGGGNGYRGFIYAGGQYVAVLEPAESCPIISEAVAVNESGLVAGIRSAAGCLDNHWLACVWDGTTITDIPPIHGFRSVAADIDDAGRVVGWMGQARHVDGRAFVWQDGKTKLLPMSPTWKTSEATCVVEVAGVPIIGGSLHRRTPPGVGFVSTACVWVGDILIEIPPLPGNDRARVLDVAPGPVAVGDCQNSASIGGPPFAWYGDAPMELTTDRALAKAELFSIGDLPSINAAGLIVSQAYTYGYDLIVGLMIPTTNIADLNGDCAVNGNDLAILLAGWGDHESIADLNGDEVVDGADLQLVLANWTG